MTTLSLGIMVPPKYLKHHRDFNAEERNNSEAERQLGGEKFGGFLNDPNRANMALRAYLGVETRTRE
ncbi:MAG: hypothetical protein EB078_08180 [Proteobacteria bacterium]|nr:hypothetical protein [Pseudomonadota bacterium]NDD04868.1 hypothetical protein [Pseudomonadota bacterium]NDG26939.1 hypothetical protein [Pseudomonadota bacterium]